MQIKTTIVLLSDVIIITKICSQNTSTADAVNQTNVGLSYAYLKIKIKVGCSL